MTKWSRKWWADVFLYAFLPGSKMKIKKRKEDWDTESAQLQKLIREGTTNSTVYEQAWDIGKLRAAHTDMVEWAINIRWAFLVTSIITGWWLDLLQVVIARYT